MSFTFAEEAWLRCCGSHAWAQAMMAAQPFADRAALMAAADKAWTRTGPADWREAITHHPRIGDVAKLREKYESTASWASQEQAGVAGAGEDVLQALAQANTEYEQRFGFTFLVCATGKTAAEMLALMRARMPNAADVELEVAAAEQAKITRIRLEKLLTP